MEENILNSNLNNSTNYIMVNIGDLINELANISGVHRALIKCNMETDVIFYGRKQLNEMLEKMNDVLYDKFANKNLLKVSIKARNFDFSFKVPLEDLSTPQSDGKKLLDHVFLEQHTDYKHDYIYTQLSINRNNHNINIKVNADKIKCCENNTKHPNHLLYKAMLTVGKPLLTKDLEK